MTAGRIVAYRTAQAMGSTRWLLALWAARGGAVPLPDVPAVAAERP